MIEMPAEQVMGWAIRNIQSHFVKKLSFVYLIFYPDHKIEKRSHRIRSNEYHQMTPIFSIEKEYSGELDF
jgi:hypothetical protein